MITWDLDDEVLNLRVRKDVYFLRKTPDQMIILFGVDDDDMFEVTGMGAELCGYLSKGMTVLEALNSYLEKIPDQKELAGEIEDFIIYLGEYDIFQENPA